MLVSTVLVGHLNQKYAQLERTVELVLQRALIVMQVIPALQAAHHKNHVQHVPMGNKLQVGVVLLGIGILMFVPTVTVDTTVMDKLDIAVEWESTVVALQSYKHVPLVQLANTLQQRMTSTLTNVHHCVPREPTELGLGSLIIPVV